MLANESIIIFLLIGILASIIILLIKVFGANQKQYQAESVFQKMWNDSGIKESIGKIEAFTLDVKQAHLDIEKMLRIPHERADIGHIGLEVILCDQLPPDRMKLGQVLFDGLKPDAAIESTAGWICIDSKFPLEGYVEIVNFEGAENITALKTQFKQKVKGHLNKIASSYVSPEKGTAEFAFAYIPSEAVYYFLVTELYELVREFASKGVQVVSPLTLCHKIDLIKAGISAKQLTERSLTVRNEIKGLQSRFEEIDLLWKTFYETHLRNAQSKANELNSAYINLKNEFKQITGEKGVSKPEKLLD